MKPLLYESETLAAYERELARASSVDFAFAQISETGLSSVRQQLESCARRGGRVRVLVGVDLPTDPTAIERLNALALKFKQNFLVKRFQSGARGIFHPKLALFQRKDGTRTAIVGSSNLTEGGLARNLEANLFVTDQPCVQRLAEYFDEIFEGARARKLDDRWLGRYKKIWNESKKERRLLRAHQQKLQRLRAPERQSCTPRLIRGKTFAFTGKISEWPRDAKLYPLVARFSGEVAPKANSMTGADFLVHGDILGGHKSTQKLRTARQLNVPVITEDEFFRAVENERRKRRK